MINTSKLVGMKYDEALALIDADVDYSGNTEYYWLTVPTLAENVHRYIRFPTNKTITIEIDLDNDVVGNVYA